MKKIILSIALIGGMLVTATAKPEASAWAVDKSHSNVNFSVTHMMMTEVDGKFKQFEGTIVSKNDDFSDSQFNFSVDVNSVNTDDEKRDGHLKSDDFFSAEKFPQLTFVSNDYKGSGDDATLNGELTIKGVTKPIKLNVEFGGAVVDPWGQSKAGFTVTGKISRKEFGLTWGAVTEAGGVVVSDDVKLHAQVQMIKQA